MELDDSTKLFRVQKTVTQMLKDRGYLVPRSHEPESLEEFKQHFDSLSKMMLKVSKEDAEGEDESLIVIYPEEEKLTVVEIERFATVMMDKSVTRAILVLRHEITKRATQTIEKIASIMHIETFHQDDLLVNITRHELVPKHLLITDAEKKALLHKYRVKESQLPRIQQTDPVARYLGLKRGQVVKILRNSETAGKYITYRIVF